MTEVRDYPGNYTQYRIAREEQISQERIEKETAKKHREKETRNDYSNRRTYKEKFEFEQLEERIKTLGLEKSELEQALAGATEHEALSRISSQLGEVAESLDAAEMRWLELSEKDPN